MRLPGVLLLLWLSFSLWGCVQDPVGARTHRLARSGDASDAASDAANDSARPDVVALEGGAWEGAPPGCGLVPEQGCCNGQVLYFCEGGVLKSIDCSSKPKCGWSNSGFHDCNTSGAPDPTGTYALYCWGILPDGGAADGAADAGACGGIGIEGCCDGTTLKFCREGELQSVSCALNPSCGWFPMGQYYDCGTLGLADPTGSHPRECPGSTAGDGNPDLFPWSEAGPDLSTDGGDGGGKGDGCGCVVAAPAPPRPPALLLVFGLVLLAIRACAGCRR